MIEPILDRILVRRINETSDSLIEIPDQYRQQSRKAEVVAVGQGVVLGQHFRPLTDFVQVGDTVYVGEYNAEPVSVDGEELLICRIQDVRYREAINV